LSPDLEPGKKKMTMFESRLIPATMMLTKKLQKQSCTAAGFFSQKMKMYL
jgi:hypothetical protein